ncbi:nucleoside recognition domain-containing protein [Caldisalinibacter kiritimatiensis]|uniref:nucleoside recognition domain-containing protein n=1 Tax=Caldisalinibacter kiritimatiensis TaxID=1304284 RepID=UPI00068A5D26|nr:nucleoside recognition domain-containing protein [Caldisalinibacter kiritimatiensis]
MKKETIDNVNNSLINKCINSLSNGLKSGIKTTWMLTKIIIPVYIFVTILKQTPAIEWISYLFSPIMNLVGLPGEAAIIIVLGNVVNLYAAIGAVASITLSVKEITIIAVMLSFSHSLFVETAVAKNTGVNVLIVLILRLSLAFISGIILNIVL